MPPGGLKNLVPRGRKTHSLNPFQKSIETIQVVSKHMFFFFFKLILIA